MVEFDIIGTEKEKITINRLYGIYGKDSTDNSKLLIIGNFVAVRDDEGQKKCCCPVIEISHLSQRSGIYPADTPADELCKDFNIEPQSAHYLWDSEAFLLTFHYEVEED